MSELKGKIIQMVEEEHKKRIEKAEKQIQKLSSNEYQADKLDSIFEDGWHNVNSSLPKNGVLCKLMVYNEKSNILKTVVGKIFEKDERSRRTWVILGNVEDYGDYISPENGYEVLAWCKLDMSPCKAIKKAYKKCCKEDD